MWSEQMYNKYAKQHIGKTYNYLTVIERDNNYKKEHNIKSAASYYKCQCKCGNFKTVRITALTSGEVKSCGCLKKQQDKINLKHGYNLQDLTGQQFGQLTVLYKDANKHDSDAFWICQCDCGNITSVRSWLLRMGKTKSCGCRKMSSGERQIADILNKNNIKYIYDQEYFKDLILPSGLIGRYDFILLNNKNEPFKLIEFDGIQHFEPIEKFGGTLGFKTRIQHDYLKNKYAIEHNLPLIRIPYYEKLTLELLNNDKYLVNPTALEPDYLEILLP